MEWLVTNGIGGYASGTVAGPLTRRYHGLLVAALDPPLQRTILVTRFDETVDEGRALDEYLESFRRDVTIPTWTFRINKAVLRKTVWMEHGANTTYVQYRLVDGDRPIRLDLAAFVNDRSHHDTTRDHPGLRSTLSGQHVRIDGGTVPFHLVAEDFDVSLRDEWECGPTLAMETFRGLDDQDENLHSADLSITLEPGDVALIVVSTDATTNTGEALKRRRDRERFLLNACPASDQIAGELALAADQFIVERETDEIEGSTIIAGYHWFADWGRDTMISLPGLALATGRNREARQIITTFARHVDRGMIPNRFTEEGDPEYNTVDATLWYVEAVRAYHRAMPDDDLIGELLPVLNSIVDWHMKGTRHGIGIDPDDGLLTAGEPGTQLTWMDARVDGTEITPRIGKPVEVNALWYQMLRVMSGFAAEVGSDASPYTAAADRVAASFARFHNLDTGYLFDVIDGPDGNDPSLRPNQLFAVALTHSPLSVDWQSKVVDACGTHLLTPMGLRTLAPFEPGYRGRFAGSPAERDSAYHQGTVWPWLIGPFATAHLRVYRNRDAVRRMITPLIAHLRERGTVTECAEGDPPHDPRGALAQAWSVAELSRVWRFLADPQGE